MSQGFFLVVPYHSSKKGQKEFAPEFAKVCRESDIESTQWSFKNEHDEFFDGSVVKPFIFTE